VVATPFPLLILIVYQTKKSFATEIPQGDATLSIGFKFSRCQNVRSTLQHPNNEKM